MHPALAVCVSFYAYHARNNHRRRLSVWFLLQQTAYSTDCSTAYPGLLYIAGSLLYSRSVLATQDFFLYSRQSTLHQYWLPRTFLYSRQSTLYQYWLPRTLIYSRQSSLLQYWLLMTLIYSRQSTLHQYWLPRTFIYSRQSSLLQYWLLMTLMYTGQSPGMYSTAGLTVLTLTYCTAHCHANPKSEVCPPHPPPPPQKKTWNKATPTGLLLILIWQSTPRPS